MTEPARQLIFFTGKMCSGGAERVISILSTQLVKRGWNVTIICYFNEPSFYHIEDQVKMVCIEKETKSKNLIRNALWLRKYIRKNASVVISFIAKFNMVAIVACLGLHIPVIVSERNDPKLAEGLLFQIIRDSFYSHANAIVAQSEYARSCFGRKIKNKTYVIYNPTDVGELKGKALTTQTSKRIVSVGRLIPQKNQKMLIQVFSKIKDEFPEHRLIIYGEGNYRKELEKEIEDLNIDNRVFLPGNNKDILNTICDAEMFILTSNYEGMPNALLEAMCIGLPVISTKTAGAVDIIQDKINGQLIDVGDNEQLAETMRSLLRNPETRQQYGKNAVKVADLLSVEKIVSQWERVVCDVME